VKVTIVGGDRGAGYGESNPSRGGLMNEGGIDGAEQEREESC